MSRARPSSDGGDIDSVSLTHDGEWIVAEADGTHVASQGQTVAEALVNLAEAIELHQDGGEDVSPDEEAAVLEELGINPDEVADARDEHDGLPESMQ